MELAERIVLVVEPGDALRPVLRAAQSVAPHARALHVVALLTGADEPHRATLERALHALELELAHWPTAAAATRAITTSFEVSFEASRVEGALVVVGPLHSRPARERVLALLELSRRGVVLSVGTHATSHSIETVCVAFTERATVPSLTAPVRRLSGVHTVVGLALGATEAARDELEATLRALLPGVRVELELLPGSTLDAGELVEAAAARRGAGLVVVPREERTVVAAVTGLLAASTLQAAERPFLIVPTELERGHQLVASDSLWQEGVPPRVTLELVGLLGRAAIAAAEVEVPGRAGLTAVGADGVVELPLEHAAPRARLTPFGITFPKPGADSVAVGQVIGPARPLVLVDEHLAPERFVDLERLAPDFELVFVRLRADAPLLELRERLNATLPWGGPALLLDASTWLDDGGADDVPRAVDGLRLVRLAVRLRSLGARLVAVVVASDDAPAERDFRVFTPATLQRHPAGALTEAPTRGDVVEVLTGARPIAGNAVTLELDNARARAALLDAAAAARERLHLQSYIFEDDEVVRAVSDALTAAAKRGVAVRVLADALYSLHGAYGATNEVLARLAAGGVEVRAWQPLSGLPSLKNLKARNHRKVVVVDGEHAWLSGRNLGLVYYRGFDEVALTRESTFADVPWLDCSARVEGPLVAELERAFLMDWERAGGAPFEVKVPAPAGTLECRLVLHDSLADANTLELQRLLIERAMRRLVVVSTFPLLSELQRALIAAVRRGVRVQLLFGNVRPRWGDGTPFGGGLYRELGDELVRARLEPVLRAGAEGYEVSFPPRANWSEDLVRVLPHVHAKLLVRDEAEVAIGSANVDVTSAYWEGEALLHVEDAGFARETLAQLEPLLASARRVDLRGTEWELLRGRREWLGRLWPTLLG